MSYVSPGCECELRDRRWNPNTGRCETCKSNYRTERNAASWRDERVTWNANGKCARKVCEAKHESMQHTESKLLYCRRCAGLINGACFGINNNQPIVVEVSPAT